MSHDILIRRARPDDRPAMERICAQTWDWGDYIPEVWDRWLADQQGALIVGELAGEPAALSKITFLTPNQVWLEGMRVDPAHRQRGVAGKFLEYALAYARDRGAQVVRLATGGHNTPVHALAARYGMRRTGVYVFWKAQPLPDGPRPVLLGAMDLDKTNAFLASSPVLAATAGLYAASWAWQKFSPERVAQLLSRGQLAGLLAPPGNLAALAMIEAEEKRLWVGFADGPIPSFHLQTDGSEVDRPPAAAAPSEAPCPPITDLATALRSHAALIGVEEAVVMLPEVDWLRAAFAEAGYGFGDWTGEMWIFELAVGQAFRPATLQDAPRHD